MAPNNDPEQEQAMEEGKSEEVELKDNEKEKTSTTKFNFKMAVAVLLLLSSLALAIGLPVGIMNKRSKEEKQDESTVGGSLPEFNATESSTRSRTRLPLVSLETLKETYPTCTELSGDLEIAARMLANRTIESNIESYFNNPYHFRDNFPVMEFASNTAGPVNFAAPAPPPEMSSMADSGGDAGRGGVSTTESSFESNNQEEGVEEPDVVKSDGVSVYAAYGSEIVKLNVANQEIESRTELPAPQADKCNLDSIASMLLVDETLLVISSGWCNDDYDDYDGPSIEPRLSIWRPAGRSVTRIVMYDKGSMELTGEKTIKGNYNSARAIGGDVYLITTKTIDSYTFTNKLNIWDTSVFGKEFTEEEYREMAIQQVEKHINAYVQQLVDDFDDCASLQRLALFQNEDIDALPSWGSLMESVSTVTGFNVETPDTVSAKSLILPYSGWQVYSSEKQLVLAAQGWWFRGGASQETYVITYGLDNAEATVMGFGTVPGYVLNQFSIDHQSKNGKDYLLFATSTRQTWGWVEVDEGEGDEPPRRSWQQQRELPKNQITVLEVPKEGELSAKMEEVGKLDGLGKPGERIYSVRFLENRAFVVTFNETDPFYTIDVTNPEDPIKVGELEIPGFSSYLHPIGENLIMGIGQYVDPESERVRREGLQISIFDVSDFANPKQIHVLTEDSGDGSGSEAEYNHMAFRYLEETGLLILPVSIYSWSRNPEDDEKPFEGFKVYQAGQEGISEYLSVNHETRDYYFHRYCWRNYRGNLAARSMVFSGVLWTMQGNAIQVSDLSTQVTSEQPIDLDEGIDDVVTCSPPFFPPEPLPLPVDVEFPDCAAVSCILVACEDEMEAFVPGGECCPVCPPLEDPPEPLPLPVDGEFPDCAAVSCLLVACEGEVEAFVPEGECCPVCPPLEEPEIDCATIDVDCAVPICEDGAEPIMIPGEGCCPVCPTPEDR